MDEKREEGVRNVNRKRVETEESFERREEHLPTCPGQV